MQSVHHCINGPPYKQIWFVVWKRNHRAEFEPVMFDYKTKRNMLMLLPSEVAKPTDFCAVINLL